MCNFQTMERRALSTKQLRSAQSSIQHRSLEQHLKQVTPTIGAVDEFQPRPRKVKRRVRIRKPLTIQQQMIKLYANATELALFKYQAKQQVRHARQVPLKAVSRNLGGYSTSSAGFQEPLMV